MARRIMERVAGDGGQQPVMLNVDVAVYPVDGKIPEALLIAAHRCLYTLKAKGSSKVGSLA